MYSVVRFGVIDISNWPVEIPAAPMPHNYVGMLLGRWHVSLAGWPLPKVLESKSSNKMVAVLAQHELTTCQTADLINQSTTETGIVQDNSCSIETTAVIQEP